MADREESLAEVEGEFEIPPHFNPDESADGSRAVRAMLKDHKKLLDEHANLAWDDRMEVRAPNGHVIPTDKRVKKSGFDGRLAYMGPYLGYWVQNRKVFQGRQRIVTLAEVPEILKDKKGEPVQVRALVKLALEIMDQQILASDSLRCKVCIDFRGEDQIDLMAHFRSKHPKELDELVVGIEKLRAEAEEDEAPKPPPPPAGKPKRQSFRAAAV